MRIQTCSSMLILAAVSLSAQDRASVKADSAPVYSGMSGSTSVVKTLKKGEAVVIDLSLAGEDGSWCNVSQNGAAAGWMRCDALAVDTEKAKTQWTTVGERGPGGRPRLSDKELTAKMREICKDIGADPGQLQTHVATAMAFGRCIEIAEGAALAPPTRADVRQWQAEADKTGAQACWAKYIELLRNTGDSREKLAAAKAGWLKDPCAANIAAFRNRVAGPQPPATSPSP